MNSVMDRRSGVHGSVVAFEGPQETVATQLRLLPSSPKLMVIPALEHFMKGQQKNSPFDARSHILRIHEANQARAEMAHSFLQGSSPNDKRIVFLNGGTAGAQRTCIATIGQHDTEGNEAQAETIFKELVRRGVAALRRQPRERSEPPSTDVTTETIVEDEEDPISKAMRAADTLDRDTASLQQNNDIDLAIMTRHRSLSVPTCRSAYDLKEGAPFSVLGASNERSGIPPPRDTQQAALRSLEAFENTDELVAQGFKPSKSKTRAILENCLLDRNIGPVPPNCAERAYDTWSLKPISADDLISPSTAAFLSMPNTPAVVYGEAHVVDVRSPHSNRCPQPLKRIKSVDRIYADGIRNQHVSLSNLNRSSASTSRHGGRPNLTLVHGPPPTEREPLRSKFFREISRATFAKPNKTMLRRSRPAPLDLSKPNPNRGSFLDLDKGISLDTEYADKGTWTGTCYVDEGSDAEEIVPKSSESDADTSIGTVLPMFEEIVIHFKDETPDPLLESVIQGFNDRSRPVSMLTLLQEPEGESDIPRTPTAGESVTSLPQSYRAGLTPTGPNSPPTYHAGDSDEYDPFAFHGNYLEPRGPWATNPGMDEQKTTVLVAPAPPTPVQTPTPIMPGKSFHDFMTTNCRTAVSVQNSLRSILNIYFSPEDGGYHQFNFPLLPELSSLWKPVFRETESADTSEATTRVDLILAIGSQKGVSREFLSAITCSLERLGINPNGIKRSGRLDLRYLIANAMQSFTSQPLADQSHNNPFTDPLLLATLIIPHLETYMAAHCETQLLLLEYPPEHLSTVLALQQHVGADLLKVAGILDADPLEPKPVPRLSFSASSGVNHSNNASISSMTGSSSSTSATLLSPAGAKASEAPSFSKANFLLTSTATESEIASLISAIRRILIGTSTFYLPEDSPRPSTCHRNSNENSDAKALGRTPSMISTPNGGPFTSAAVKTAVSTPPISPLQATAVKSGQSVTSHLARDTPEVVTTTKHYVQPPSSGSIKSSKTAKIRMVQHSKLREMLGQEATADDDRSILRPNTAESHFDVSDDEESRFYADERRYMPLFGKKPEARREDSRKALKWLGLA
ncbi:hypothetical protein BJ170DRAFT_597780 [Xylariales sp. AK1849]|nr:hypothetical protein BJ170DRAFT_597780 [Xylariales sp. AK1849]